MGFVPSARIGMFWGHAHQIVQGRAGTTGYEVNFFWILNVAQYWVMIYYVQWMSWQPGFFGSAASASPRSKPKKLKICIETTRKFWIIILQVRRDANHHDAGNGATCKCAISWAASPLLSGCHYQWNRGLDGHCSGGACCCCPYCFLPPAADSSRAFCFHCQNNFVSRYFWSDLLLLFACCTSPASSSGCASVPRPRLTWRPTPPITTKGARRQRGK